MSDRLRSRAARPTYDAIVVGAGPNGLSAAIALARRSLSVLLVEARPTVGGGARSEELTLPGFVHDVCSAIHPMALLSPWFRELRLDEHGLEWTFSPAPLAHPLADGTAALLERDGAAMEETLGADGRAWRRLFAPLAARSDELFAEILGPPRLPRSPLLLLRFGLSALRSAAALAKDAFRGDAARGLFAGCAAHSFLPLERACSAAFGLALGVAAHAVGWPCARGGSRRITEALVARLVSSGGEIITGERVASLTELPRASVVLFDLAPRAVARIAGDELPAGYRRRLEQFRAGPGAFKVDWALDGPIPWRAPACARAATVHVGGTLEEIAASERACWSGTPAERPFVLVAQQSLFDRTRAPDGKQTGWAYCHVPNGCAYDMTDRIEAQIERFAPGFRQRILARSVRAPADLERDNENYVGGDIAGGANDLGQIFTRPVARLVPYTTPNPRLYLCSSSTPPGAGVHGLCGFFAARAALTRLRRRASD